MEARGRGGGGISRIQGRSGRRDGFIYSGDDVGEDVVFKRTYIINRASALAAATTPPPLSKPL